MVAGKITDAAILKKIEHQPKRTAGFKQLVRELGLHGDARRELAELLQRLVASGQLLQVDSERFALPQAAAGRNLLVGRLSMHRDGFGFVIPDASSLDERLKARLSGDIFIPPPAIGSAMHGDRVLVEIGAIRPDGRAEGRIVRPVVRAHTTVVGTFHYGSRRNYVTPMDAKISQEIGIPFVGWRVKYVRIQPDAVAHRHPDMQYSLDRAWRRRASQRRENDKRGYNPAHSDTF